MNRITGFSLVELLVAILVLAIGLVGLAALQIAGVRSNQIAYYRSIATQFAYDMADRMRANPVGVADGAYNMGHPAPPPLPSVKLPLAHPMFWPNTISCDGIMRWPRTCPEAQASYAL